MLGNYRLDSHVTLKPPEDEVGYRWLQNPAIFCDYFSLDVMADSGIVRIALGEFVHPEYTALFRVGVAMPIADAEMMAKVILQSIEEMRTKEAAAEANDLPTQST